MFLWVGPDNLPLHDYQERDKLLISEGLSGAMGHLSYAKKAVDKDHYNPSQRLLTTQSLGVPFKGPQPREVYGLRDGG